MACNDYQHCRENIKYDCFEGAKVRKKDSNLSPPLENIFEIGPSTTTQSLIEGILVRHFV